MQIESLFLPHAYLFPSHHMYAKNTCEFAVASSHIIFNALYSKFAQENIWKQIDF